MSRYFTRFSRNFFANKTSFTRHWKKGLVLFSVPTVAYLNQADQLLDHVVKDLKTNGQIFEPIHGKNDKLESLFPTNRENKSKKYFFDPMKLPLYFQLFDEVWVCCEANLIERDNSATSLMFAYSPINYLMNASPNEQAPGKYIVLTEYVGEEKPPMWNNGEVLLQKIEQDPCDFSNTISKEIQFFVDNKTSPGGTAFQLTETNAKYNYLRTIMLVYEFDKNFESEKFVASMKRLFSSL